MALNWNTNYVSELTAAVKSTRADMAKAEASDKGRELLKRTEEGIRNKRPEVQTPAERVQEKGKSLIETIKARKAMIDRAGE